MDSAASLRSMPRVVPSLVLAVSVVLLAGRMASATVLIPMRDEDLVASSALIVVGTVRRIETQALDDGRLVTEVTLAAERVLKGHLRGRKLVVTQPGGRLGTRILGIHGAATFALRERVLVFLTEAADGRLRTNALALGKYRIDGTVARRRIPTPDVRDLESFLGRVRSLAAGAAVGPALDGRVRRRARARSVTAPFTFLGDPPSRWFQPTVTFQVANGDTALGPTVSAAVIDAAQAAWTDVGSATIVLDATIGAATGPSIAGGTCDGRSVIQFNDPAAEISSLASCAGVLAVGGFCVSADTSNVGGTTFRHIVEGDITMNAGLGGCFGATGMAEVMTHEMGHAIGLGHSSEEAGEPDAALREATMFYLAHIDGRGASLRADDLDGVTALYPGAGAGSADADGDGVPDPLDDCPATQPGAAVDPDGCACSDPGHVACDDGSACTTDACNVASGRCTLTPVDCADADPCSADTCAPATGCAHTPIPDSDDDGLCDAIDDSDADGVVDLNDGCPATPAGRAVDVTGCACDDPGRVSCDDGDACTTDACDGASAACVHAAITCDDADACTADACAAATGCTHVASGDGDADGLCDALDRCPRVANAAQTDADGDGVGDACECGEARPGQCVAAPGRPFQRCLVEWRPQAPAVLKRGLPSTRLRCRDGDPACDADATPGQCTFTTLLCINNRDPRFPACVPFTTDRLSVRLPRKLRDAVDGANVAALQGALDLGAQTLDQCSAPLALEVPTRGTRRGVRKVAVRVDARGGRATGALTLVCDP